MTDYLEEAFQLEIRTFALMCSKSFARLCYDKLRNPKPDAPIFMKVCSSVKSCELDKYTDIIECQKIVIITCT